MIMEFNFEVNYAIKMEWMHYRTDLSKTEKKNSE